MKGHSLPLKSLSAIFLGTGDFSYVQFSDLEEHIHVTHKHIIYCMGHMFYDAVSKAEIIWS